MILRYLLFQQKGKEKGEKRNLAEQNGYRFIRYNETNYKMSVTKIDYYHPHFHREIEICLLIYGNYAATCDGKTICLKPGDFWIVNPCAVHEYQSLDHGKKAIMLELQMREDFFRNYYPQLANLRFPFEIINRDTMKTEEYEIILKIFMKLGMKYFGKEQAYQLETAGLINLLFYQLVTTVPCREMKAEEREQALQKAGRMKELTDYIDSHYQQTLYLSQIADQNGISMSRLSHVFKETFGMSFQEYLQKIRCEKAGEYLRNTDLQILDISLACGFSDPKYMNRGFRKLYGMKPGEYRKEYLKKIRNEITSPDEETDVFCDDEYALAILEYSGFLR